MHNGAMARILLGITGGIAAYKACELVRLLVKAGHDVLPVPTSGAERFIRAETFFALARKSQGGDPYPHLQRADLLAIAPLTANTMAKLAHGLADDVLTEAALAHRGPVLVAPAMNTRMWEHEATQANAATLRARGIELIGPEAGELAEGEVGLGRMSEPEEIARRIEEILGAHRGSLAGRRVLVSAGGTREPLDAVRFLGNRSSGRQGAALARTALARGARVTLVVANMEVQPPAGATVVRVESTAELRVALHRLIRAEDGSAGFDALVMAAAVADFSPAASAGHKLERGAGMTLELRPTPDVLAEIARIVHGSNGDGDGVTAGVTAGAPILPRPVLVGFAAETGSLDRAVEKLRRKGLDLLVANDVAEAGSGFGTDTNRVSILAADGSRDDLPLLPKREVADAILDRVAARLTARTLDARPLDAQTSRT